MEAIDIIIDSILNNVVDNTITDKKIFDIIYEHDISDDMIQEILREIESRNIEVKYDSELVSHSCESDDSSAGYDGQVKIKSGKSNVSSIKNTHSISDSSKSLYIKRMAENLTVLRAKTGLTQAELAELVGVSRQTIISFEKQQRDLTWSMFLALLLIFGSYEQTASLVELFEIRPASFKQIVKKSEINSDETITKKYETIISEKDIQIQDLSSKLTLLKNKLTEAETKLTSSENKSVDDSVIQQYELAISERNTHIQMLNNQLIELNNKVTEANIAISNGKTKLNTFSEKISIQDEEIRRLNEEIQNERIKPWYKRLLGK